MWHALPAVRVCLLYDCLYPHTIGGAERWYSQLAERLIAEGHEVTYLTLRQWDRHERPRVDPRLRVVCVGPRMALYTEGRRRIVPPLVFGLGVLWHLLRHGSRYDVVHTASFPYFSLLAAGALRRTAHYGLVVDWHEVWSRDYWQEYLGRVGGLIGLRVQRACARLSQHAFCFSELHAGRLRAAGLRGEVTVLRGEYAGSLQTPAANTTEYLVVFAGRLIPEKRVGLAVAAVGLAAREIPELRAEFYGDGPERQALNAAILAHGLSERASALGFVDGATVDAALRRAACMLLTSRREGYGMVVVEAAARATPSVVVAGPDNAATELIEDGVNGIVVASDTPAAVSAAIVDLLRAGVAARERTAHWFTANAQRLSLESSLRTVLERYASGPPA